MQQDQGKLLAITMSSLQVIDSLKASAAEGDCFERWAGYQAKVVSAEQALAAATELLLTVPAFLSLLTGVLILGAGGLRVMDGQLSMGELLALQAAMTSSSPRSTTRRPGRDAANRPGDLGRLDDVLRYRLDPTAADGEAEPGGTPRLSGHVVLRNVTFGYSRVEAPLIAVSTWSCAR